MGSFDESAVEEASLQWLASIGYAVAHGPDLAPGGAAAERRSYADVVLVERLRLALADINPAVPPDAIEDAVRKLVQPESPSLVENTASVSRPALTPPRSSPCRSA